MFLGHGAGALLTGAVGSPPSWCICGLDRYVLTGGQPAPHATAAEATASGDLVERYAAMAAGIGTHLARLNPRVKGQAHPCCAAASP